MNFVAKMKFVLENHNVYKNKSKYQNISYKSAYKKVKLQFYKK